MEKGITTKDGRYVLSRKCKECGTWFELKRFNQCYCSRSCFWKAWRRNRKVSKFPYYTCQYCGKKVELDFFPLLSTKRWKEFTCPYCGRSNKEVVEKIDGSVVV